MDVQGYRIVEKVLILGCEDDLRYKKAEEAGVKIRCRRLYAVYLMNKSNDLKLERKVTNIK